MARRIEYRDIGLPYTVGYCTVCHLSVDCLSGEDVCACDMLDEIARCSATDSGGAQCELPAGHEGRHACPRAADAHERRMRR